MAAPNGHTDRARSTHGRPFGRIVALFVLSLTALASLGLRAPAHASPSLNRLLNYQVRLTDAAGVPVADGTKNVKISFYDAASGGTRVATDCGTVGTPVARKVVFSNGTGTVLIGDVGADASHNCSDATAPNAISATLFNADLVYLGVTVEADAEMTPRKRIVATAYSLNADRLDDLDTSAAGGLNAYVPVTDSSGNLTLSANVTVDTSTLFVDSANNRIGVGTASPSNVLTVSGGSSNVPAYVTGSGTLTRMAVNHATDAGFGYFIGDAVKFTSNVVQLGAGNLDFQIYNDQLTSSALVVDGSSNNVGIGDASPASLLTVGSGDRFNVNASGDVTSTFTTLDGSTTANGAGSNSTTLVVNSGTNFNDGNYVQVASAACVANPCFAKIVSGGGTATLTISPALSWSNADVVTEVHVPEVGGVNLTQALANRYGRGYFIDGIVTGNGSTRFTDNLIDTTAGTLNINSTGSVLINGGSGSTGCTIDSSGNFACTGTVTGGGGGSGWTDGGTDVTLSTSTDNVGIGGASLAKLSVDGDANEIQFLVQANATQTSDLFVAESSAGADYFAIQGDGDVFVDTNTLFVDATNNRLGIGLTNPSATVHVNADGAANDIRSSSYNDGTAATTATMTIMRGDGTRALPTAIDSGDYLGSLRFVGQYGTLLSDLSLGAGIDAIAAENWGATANGTNLAFSTALSGTLAQPVERMRIDNAGNVGIGDSTPDAMLDVAGAVQWDGNATMGDATGDTLTINASTASIPNNLNFDAGTLFIDSTNNRVTVGSSTANTGNLFMVSKSDAGTNIDTVNAWSSIHNSNTTNNTLSILTFATNETGGTLAGGARLAAQFTSHAIGGVSADFIFQNRSAGAWIEPLVIRSTGNIEFDASTLFVDAANNRVGIGDTTPAASLTVGNGDLFQVNSSGNLTSPNDVTWTLGGGVNGLNFDSNTLSIDATNNRVGIGTAAPLNALHVLSATASNVVAETTGDASVFIQAVSANTTRTSQLAVLNSSGSASGVMSARGTAASGVSGSFLGIALNDTVDFKANGSSGLLFGTDDAAPLVLGTNNFERLRIDTTGNVGIGDSTPDATLDVAGSFQADDNVVFGNAMADTVTSNSAIWTFANDTTFALNNSPAALNFDSNTLVVDATNNRIGIGDSSPAAALTVGSGDLFQVSSIGDVTSSFTALDGTDLANGAGTNATTLVLDDTTGFNAGNYVLVNSTYAKIVSVDSLTNLTISPALTWADNATVDEYHVPEVGGTDTASTLANRYGRGYFIDGIVAGNGSTYITDNKIESGGTLVINGVGNQPITFGTGTVTIPGTLSVTSTGNSTLSGPLRLANLSGADPTGTNGLTYYNTTSNKFRCYQGGAWTDCIGSGGGMSIGGTVTSATAGSILFANAGPVLAQDNANFFWDDTNNRLGIGTATPNNKLQVAGLISFDDVNFNTFLGSSTGGSAGATDDRNTAIGYQAGDAFNNSGGLDNTVMGYQAGSALTSGDSNVAIGRGALLSATISQGATAIGTEALASDTGGTGSVAVGYASMASNVDGLQNTALGYQSLFLNVTGDRNVGLGNQALYSTTSDDNTGVGFGAIGALTTGSKNVAVGASAGYNLVSGTRDVFIGMESAFNATASDITAVGYRALLANSSGASNTALGGLAGDTISTGSSNTFLGYNADATVNSLTNAAAIGANASVSCNNCMVLGSGVNVGIGTASPVTRLDLAGNLRTTGRANGVLTGSIDPTASTSVTGVGTLFTTELVVGDQIAVNGEARTVTAIASDTSLTVATAFTDTPNDTSIDVQYAMAALRDSGGATKMVVDVVGSVGIGTASPASGSLTVGDTNRFIIFTSSGSAQTAGDFALNGGDLTTTSTTFNLVNSTATTVNFAGAATTLNLGPSGAGAASITIGGGSADTGCTVANATGNLTCTGNITGAATGTVGYWTRSGTTLNPATAGDNIATGGSGTITSSGLLTASNGLTLSSGALNLTAGAVNLSGTSGSISLTGFGTTSITSTTATGNIFAVADNALTLGVLHDLSSTSTTLSGGVLLRITKTGTSGSTAFTGAMQAINYSQTFNGGVALNSTGKVFQATRTITLDNSGQTHTISGALASFSDNGGVVAGTLSSTADVVQIGQNFVENTGAALNVTTATTFAGLAMRVNDDGTFTDSTPFVIDNAGNVGVGDSSPSALLTVGSGDKFKVNADGDVTSGFTTLNGSSVTTGPGTNSTTLILTTPGGGTNFDVGNYVQVASAACVTNPCYAKITAKLTDTLTISPALSWNNGDTVTEVHIPEIGGVNLTQALANRYGRGYFIDGIVTGNGSTYITDNKIESGGTLVINGGSNQPVTFGTGTVTVPGTLSVTSTGNSTLNGPLRLANVADPDPTGTNGLMYYNTTNNKFRCYQGGAWTDCIGAGGGMSIGGTVTSGTTGSLLFVGSGPVLAQDNANLFFDDTNNRLGIGDVNPTNSLDVTGAIGISDTAVIDSSRRFFAANGAVGSGTLAYGFSADANTGIYGTGSDEIGFVTNGVEAMRVEVDGNSSTLLQLGTSAPISIITADSNDVTNGIAGVAMYGHITSGTNFSGGQYAGVRSRGTKASPTGVASGDGLANFLGVGRTSAGGFNYGGMIAIRAAETFSSTASGGEIAFLTTSIGSDGLSTLNASQRMVLTSAGNLGIGDASPLATLTVGNGDLFQVAGASGNVTTSGDVAVNGGDITTSAATFNLINGTNTTLNIGNGITTTNLTIGSGQTTGTISFGGTGASASGPINIGPGTASQSINIGTGGGSKTINIATGANSSNVTIGGTGSNAIAIGNTQTSGSISMGAAMTTGTITIGGTGAQTGTVGIATGSGAQTINLGTGGTGTKTINIGTAAVANALSIGNSTVGTTLALTGGASWSISTAGLLTTANDVAVNGGDLTTTSATATLFNTNATTLSVGGAATTLDLAGGSGSTGCTIDASGNFACSGTVGTGGTLQASYNGSTTPELTLDSTRGGLTIRDASSPIGTNLLEIQNNAGGTTYLGLTTSALTLGVDVLPSTAPTTGSASRTTSFVASGQGAVGDTNDVVVASDTYPVIAFYDQSVGDLRVAKCSSTTCASGVTYTTVDSTGTVGSNPHIALGSDGFPVISYYDSTNQDLKVLKCGNASCSGGNTITTVDSTGDVGSHNDIAVDAADGFPVISYYDSTNQDLKVLKCGNASCSTGNTITTVDSTGNVGLYTSISVPAAGTPIVSYQDATNADLKVIKCGNASCSAGNTTTMVSGSGGYYTSIFAPSSGNPAVSFNDGFWLYVTRCGNASCSAGNTTTAVDSNGFARGTTSITVPSDTFPVVSFYNYDDTAPPAVEWLGLAKCSNATCTALSSNTSIGTGNGVTNAITLASDGFPFVSYYDNYGAQGSLKSVRCGNAACNSGNTNATLMSFADTYGDYADAAIPSDGLPVVSYYANTGDLYVTKCGNASCSSGNTTTAVDATANNTGQYTSIAIGTDGYPVISYYDVTAGDLKVAKCGNASCSSGNTITTVDSTGTVGAYSSIAVPSDGFPIVSYYDATNSDLKVLKCGNASCSSGNTATTVESTSVTGLYTSIAIGADDLAVISYFYNTATNALKVKKCSNAACTSSSFGATVASGTSVGTDTSIAVPADGLPVVSYRNGTGGLGVVKCGNASCNSGNIVSVVDSTSIVGGATSIAVPAGGTPIIVYLSGASSGAVRAAKCTNPSCSNANIATVISGTTNKYSTIALIPGGFPTIFYHDTTTTETPGLKATACVDGACENATKTSYAGGKNIGSTSSYFTNVYASTFWGKNYRIENFDLAETYRVRDTDIAAGDIVRVAKRVSGGPAVEKTTRAYDAAMGVISTQPGLLLTEWDSPDDARPVALKGRVPVKVNNEGGAIQAGDAITASSVPGVGMRATKPGRIVGYALDDWDGISGTVELFVNPGFNDAGALTADESGLSINVSAAMAAKSDATPESPSDSLGFRLRGSAWDAVLVAAVHREFSMTNVVTDKDSYRLSVKNTEGDELAYFGSSGDVALKGKLFIGDKGALQSDRYLTFDGSTGLSGDRMVTNASGWGSVGSGYAEMFASDDDLAVGELVMVDTQAASKMRRAVGGRDDAPAWLLAGIVSERAGFLAGMNDVGTFPITIEGRAQARVVGPIGIGDPITVSLTDGVGVVATTPTYVVGYALEAKASDGPGTVTVFVKIGWWNGGGIESANDTTSGDTTSGLTVNENTLDIGRRVMLAVGAMEGMDGLWSIDGAGRLTAKEVVADTVIAKKLTVRKTDALQTVGTGTVVAGSFAAVVSNTAITANSHVIITFRTDPGTRWWIDEVHDGSFILKTAEPVGMDTKFTYLIVDVIDETTPPAEEVVAVPPQVDAIPTVESAAETEDAPVPEESAVPLEDSGATAPAENADEISSSTGQESEPVVLP